MERHVRSDGTARTLDEIIESMNFAEKTLRICNATCGSATLETLVSFFEPHDLEIVVETVSNRPDDVVDLYDRGTRIASSSVSAVVQYVRDWETNELDPAREPPTVVEELRDNYFESYDKQRMILASRIGEIRAWSNGSGTVHAGFQQLSKVTLQEAVYRNLAELGVEVHVYGEGDEELPADLEVVAHRSADEEITGHWWVAYDGDGDDEEKTVLLAQERRPNRFYGFWTEHPSVVDEVIARLADLRRDDQEPES